MLDCAEFLEDYTDFRDGSLEAGRRVDFEAHLAACASCARYDRVLREGVELFRGLPEIEPSSDFLPRLQHRIFHVEDEARLRERRASGASAVLIGGIAVAIGATAWAPLMRAHPAVVELPPVVAHAPHKVEAVQHLFRSGPILTGSPPAPGAATTSLFHQYSPIARFASSPMQPR